MDMKLCHKTLNLEGGLIQMNKRWSMWVWLWHCEIRRHKIEVNVVEFDDGSGIAYFDCSCGDEFEVSWDRPYERTR